MVKKIQGKMNRKHRFFSYLEEGHSVWETITFEDLVGFESFFKNKNKRKSKKVFNNICKKDNIGYKLTKLELVK